MLFNKIGEFASFDQRANLGKTPRRIRLVAMMVPALTRMVVMHVIVIRVIMMCMIVMCMIMRFSGLTGMHGRVIRCLSMEIVVLRSMVSCSGVNVKFYAGDSCASLALEMQVAIAQVQF